MASTLASLSPAMRNIKKYLIQAKQVERVDAKMTYFLSEGMKVPERTKEDTAYLMSLMDWLENSNAVQGLSTDDRKKHAYDFALSVFANGDNEDRAGQATENTARCFMAAFVFLDVCKQFGALPEDLEEKMRYAAWKAADIRRALREGRIPTPGDASSSTAGLAEAFGVDEPQAGGFGSLDDPRASAPGGPPLGARAGASVDASAPAGAAGTAATTAAQSPPSTTAQPEPDHSARFAGGWTAGAPPAAAAAGAAYDIYSPSQQQQQQHGSPASTSGRAAPPSTGAASSTGVPTQSLNSRPYPATAASAAASAGPSAILRQSPPAAGAAHSAAHSAAHPQRSFVDSGSADIVTIAANRNFGSKTAAFKEADRLCRHVVSSLAFEDGETAVQKLTAALAAILPYRSAKPEDD